MSPPEIAIRPAAVKDATACAEILEHYIRHTVVNMHTSPPPASYFAELMKEDSFLVAEAGGQVCGYAYADAWSGRCGYARTVEVSVYLRPENTGAGAGQKLMHALLDSLRNAGMRAAIAQITLPNPQSIRMHEKCGFARAGVLPSVGWKFNSAYDVGIWVNNLA